MDSLVYRLQKDPFIDKISKIAKKQRFKLYLVGGFLRDLYLARLKKDYDLDFATPKDAIKIARFFSRKLKSGFVVLDKIHATARVVYREEDAKHTIDFSDFRASSLKEDLYKRDFTINTLALALDDLEKIGNFKKSVKDHYNAISDIDGRKIAVLNRQTFDEDPLRILRAFSLSANLGFKIMPGTLSLIKLKKEKIRHMAAERINEELFKILGTDDSVNILRMMDRLKVLKILIPQIKVMYAVKQGPYHHLDVWGHSLEALFQFESYIRQLPKDSRIKDYLEEVISANHRRFQLLKLAIILHDIAKPETMFIEDGKTKFYGHERAALKFVEAISKRLRFSTREKELISRVVLWHLRPGYLADSKVLSQRAKFRFFRDTAGEALSVLLISLADQRATRGPLTNKTSRSRHEKLVADLIGEYFKDKEERKQPRLITGHDLIKKFKLGPSPLIGKILAEIREAQAVGLIKTKKEALRHADLFIKKNQARLGRYVRARKSACLTGP
ncbi:MAG: HD domain-containing protein [Candidatus Omnitrophota bacterium]